MSFFYRSIFPLRFIEHSPCVSGFYDPKERAVKERERKKDRRKGIEVDPIHCATKPIFYISKLKSSRQGFIAESESKRAKRITCTAQ